MIGLDTNILVRYLAQDDPLQSPIATEIVEFSVTEENPGFISVVAMVETVWVLAYRRTRGQSRLRAHTDLRQVGFKTARIRTRPPGDVAAD